jgi:POT family proton-dependent oligopeptide transporter
MSSATHRTGPDPNQTGWPGGIRYIIGNEGCERFSYYGMKAILLIYVTGLLMNLEGMGAKEANAEATIVTHTFNAAVYALPLVGALIADRLLGKYQTIIWLSIVYCLGHLALALFESPAVQMSLLGIENPADVPIDPLTGLYLGLGLIAAGSGGIKPCVSAHVGDQFGKSNWHLLQKVYNAFYFIINFGSAFATIIIPIIRGKVGEISAAGECIPLESGADMVGNVCYTGSVGLAFGIPGILMGLATIAFWMGRRKFIHVPSNPGGKLGLLDVLSGTFLANMLIYPIFLRGQFGTGPVATALVIAASFAIHLAIFRYRQKIEPDDGFLAILYFSVTRKLRAARGASGSGFFGPATEKYGADIVEGPIAVLRIMSVFLMVSVFWGLFDQHSTTWLKQAQMMDRQLGVALFSFDPNAAYGLTFSDSAALLNEWIFIGLGLGLTLGLTAYVSFTKKSKKLIGLAVGLVGGLAVGLLAFNSGGYYDLQASQVPAINPFLVMLLIPATTFGIYPLMEKMGFTPHPLRRMTIGMFMASLAFVAVAFVQIAVDEAAERGETVHVVWQIIPYVIMTLSEVMVSITGLEFGYSQAPKRVKSVIMGIWLLMVSLGNVLVAFVANFQMGPLEFFWVFAGLMAVAALLFGLRAASYTYKDYAQG